MSRKSTHKKKSYKQYIRESLKSGFAWDANGNKMTMRLTGDGRGMFDQMMAGSRLPPYDRKTKLSSKGDTP